MCHNHCCARSNFRFTTRVRLRHVRRSAHLGHMLAAFHLWSRHRSFWDHARQQRRSSPADHQEDDGYGGETSHDVSLGRQCLGAQVIPITVLSDLGFSDSESANPAPSTKGRSHNALRPRTMAYLQVPAAETEMINAPFYIRQGDSSSQLCNCQEQRMRRCGRTQQTASHDFPRFLREISLWV